MEILKAPDKAMEYLLMNKDTPLLEFSCIHNVFGETECREESWLSELRPFGYVELTLFLERRKAPKHRANIQALLERYGCEDLEGFLQVTHAASLNDTLWVKPEKSPLQWTDVSLYQNEFDEVVSRTAFDGTASSQTFSSSSPEFGTDGSYAKCWVREGDGIYLYKTGSPLFEIEPFSEYFAAQVAKLLCPACVDYDLDSYHGKLISKCKLFTSEQVGFVPASRMCVLDALIFNPDRHYGNFGVLFDNDTYKVLDMAPVFDHNKSLFPEVDDDKFNDLSWYIAHCKPRLGTDHITTAREMLTPEIRQDMETVGYLNTIHKATAGNKMQPVQVFSKSNIHDAICRMVAQGKAGTGYDEAATRRSSVIFPKLIMPTAIVRRPTLCARWTTRTAA